MKAKIFKALLLIAVCLAPVLTASAQQFSRVVRVRPITVMPMNNAANIQAVFASLVKISGRAYEPVRRFIRVDTGNKNVYVFTTSDIIQPDPDPETPINYLFSGDEPGGDNNVELVKNYSKSYSVNAKDKLEIDNLYGKISVNTWNRNEIKVDVQVRVAAKDEADAKKLLDKVSINNNKTGSKVSFKTNIAKESVWNLLSGNNKNIYRRVEINYNIFMPTRNALDISNQWGVIELPDFDGKVVIKCSYTNLIAKSLSNTAEININNGNAKIAKLKMSDLNISYGNLSLGSADNLTAVVNFSSAKIGKINTSGVINMLYGTGLQIDDLDKNMKNLSVNSSFSNVKLGLSDTKNANFTVTVHNGSFSYNNPAINIAAKNPADSTVNNGEWQPSQNYKGQVGKGSTTQLININSSYGSVKFD